MSKATSFRTLALDASPPEIPINLNYSSPWEIHTHSADYVGDRFALFALGSLITMANLNPLIPIHGDVPHLGHSVVKYEPWFTILCTCIVGAHLVITAATMVLVRRATLDDREYELPGTVRSQGSNWWGQEM